MSNNFETPSQIGARADEAFIVSTDSGGTFVDAVILDASGKVTIGKSPTTPDDPAVGILSAVRAAAERANLDFDVVMSRCEMFLNGTTVTTNAMIERTGARTGMITTRGFEDTLIIGRGKSRWVGLDEAALADFKNVVRPAPVVPTSLVRGVSERIDSFGEVVVPLDLVETEAAIDALVAEGIEALSICLLWSFKNAEHETAIAALARRKYPDLYIVASSELVQSMGEYERSNTTAIDAYLGPTLRRYLSKIGASLQDAGYKGELLVMQSIGGLAPASGLLTAAVTTLQSGPSGGIVAAQKLGELIGEPNVITADMGGTTLDVGIVVDGRPQTAKTSVMARNLMLVPAVEAISIGAGGGSLAWLDSANALHVGPQSQGSRPGPACYGRGGTLPTVTDADVVLGYINPEPGAVSMFFFDHDSRESKAPSRLNPRALGEAYFQLDAYLRLDEQERFQTDVPTVWKAELHPTVLSALKTLSHDKCPFCERQVSELLPYRFRPPAYLEPSAVPEDKWRYLWLTFSWQNLYPICRGCWPGEPAFFPVRGRRLSATISEEVLTYPRPEQGGNETPVLLYPGEEKRPDRSFRITIDGLLFGKNPRARATIEHFNFNRLELVRARRQAIGDELNDLVSGRFVTRQAGDFVGLEFGGAIYLVLRRVASELAPKYGRRASLAPHRISVVLRDWSNSPAFRNDVNAAVNRLHAADRDSGSEKASDDLDFRSTRQGEGAGRLRHVKVRNFKSLESVDLSIPDSFDGETPCLLILGENAAGKSSLLQAVVSACISPPELAQLGIEFDTTIHDPSLLGGTGLPAGEITVELQFEKAGRSMMIMRDGIVAEQSRVPQVFAYGPSRHYGASERRGRLKNVDTLFSLKLMSNPAPWLARLARARPEMLAEVVSALRYVIQIDGDFSHIEIDDSRGVNEAVCYIYVKKMARDGSTFVVKQRLDAASSGYRSILALICDLYAGLMTAAELAGSPGSTIARDAREMEALVLIDEIEAHLHPRWKLGIITGLRRAFPKIMFIMTSHDPLCVRGMRNGEVTVLNRYQTGDAARPEAVEAVALDGDFSRMTVEQLLTSELFQLFSTDDARVNHKFAEMSVLLSRREALDAVEERVLASFEEQVAHGLPYGLTEVSRLVNEAVAEYVQVRRTADAAAVSRSRQRAKDEIKSFLRGLVE